MVEHNFLYSIFAPFKNGLLFYILFWLQMPHLITMFASFVSVCASQENYKKVVCKLLPKLRTLDGN